MFQIKEIDVVDSYYKLDIATTYKYDPQRIAKGLLDVFADFGLKIVEIGSEAYKVIRKRYIRVLDRIKSNKSHAKARYDNFDQEKLLFCSTEYPNLCDNNSTAR